MDRDGRRKKNIAVQVADEALDELEDTTKPVTDAISRRDIFKVGALALFSVLNTPDTSDNPSSERQEFIAECRKISKSDKLADQAYGDLYDRITEARTEGVAVGLVAGKVVDILTQPQYAEILVENLARTISERVDAVVDWNVEQSRSGFVELTEKGKSGVIPIPKRKTR